MYHQVNVLALYTNYHLNCIPNKPNDGEPSVFLTSTREWGVRHLNSICFHFCVIVSFKVYISHLLRKSIWHWPWHWHLALISFLMNEITHAF